MKDYPKLTPDTPENIQEILRYVIKERRNDVQDFIKLKDVFMSGRRVARVPTSSLDVTAEDCVGDFNITATYAYFLINNSGSAEWRRVALQSW